MEEFKDEIVEETSTVADPAFANEDITPHKPEEEIKIPALESLRNKFGKAYKRVIH